MIRTLNAGPYLRIENGFSSDPYIGGSTAPMTGMVRFVNSNFEVYDGLVWRQIGSAFPTISLHEDAVKAIEWSMKKLAEEDKIKEICQRNPAVEIAYEHFKKASDQLKTTIILSQNEQSPS